jgi:hypothetical protein
MTLFDPVEEPLSNAPDLLAERVAPVHFVPARHRLAYRPKARSSIYPAPPSSQVSSVMVSSRNGPGFDVATYDEQPPLMEIGVGVINISAKSLGGAGSWPIAIVQASDAGG